MTLWDLGFGLVRRWYVVLVGLICTAAAAAFVIATPGVYFARTEVVFLAETGPDNPNTLLTTSSDIIIFASVVANIINGTDPPPKSSSPDATIVGRGVRDGYSVALPDMGGQWVPSFGRQVLDVQVVGSSYEEVEDRTRDLVRQIGEVLAKLQDQAAVDSANRIVTQPLPEEPAIAYLQGQPKRAVAATLALGTTLTVMAVVLLESLSAKNTVGFDGYRGRPTRQRPKVGSAALMGTR